MDIKKYIPYGISGMLFLWIISLNDHLNESVAKAILFFYAKCAEVLFRFSHIYVEGIGYEELSGLYIISRDCLGFRFTGLIFFALAFSYLGAIKKTHKYQWLGIFLFTAFTAGVFTNCLRILYSIIFVSYEKFSTIHLILGVSLNLGTLTAIYIICHYILEKKGYFGQKI